MNLNRLGASLCAVLALSVLAPSANAQILTADTIMGDPTDGIFILSTGTAATQTFSNISGIQSLTFRFVIADGSFNTAADSTFDFLMTEWAGGNSSGNSVAGGSGNVTILTSDWIAGSGGYHYFDSALDLSSLSLLDPGTTYGLSFIGNADTNTSNIAIARNATDALYTGGSGFFNPTGNNAGALTTGNFSVSADFVFTTTGASPVPEASTVAVLFAGMFVGCMVFVRQRRRGQVALTAVPQV